MRHRSLIAGGNWDNAANAGSRSRNANNYRWTSAQYKFAQLGRSIYFDGNSDYLTLEDSADWDFGAGDFTIDCWVRFNSSTASQTIVEQWQDDNNEWYFQASTGSDLLIFQQIVGGVYDANYYCSWTPSDNTWYHLALVRSGTTCKMFIDGVSQSVTAGTTWGTLTALSGTLYIGALKQAASFYNYFDGYMSCLRITKGTALWTSNFTPPIYSSYKGARSVYVLSGLNGDVDEEYELIVRNINGADGGNLACRINGDTGSNYGTQELQGADTAASAGRGAFDRIYMHYGASNTSYVSLVNLKIHAKSGYVRTGLMKSTNTITGTTVGKIELQGLSWNNTADNITSLTVFNNIANGIGVGSRIILLKKVKDTTGFKTGLLTVQGKVHGVWEEIYSYTITDTVTTNFESGATADAAGPIGDAGGDEYTLSVKVVIPSTIWCTGFSISLDANTGTPSGDITLRLETDSTGPSGTLAHANATGAFTPTASAWNRKNVAGFTLAAGTYWLTASTTAQATDSHYNWTHDTDGGTNTRWYSANGGAWIGPDNVYNYFRIYADGIQTSITIPSLTGNTDVLYRLRCRYVSTAVDSTYGIRINNDSTANIYGDQYVYGNNTTAGAARGTNTKWINGISGGVTVPDVSYSETLIYVKSGFVRTAISSVTAPVLGTAIANVWLYGQSYNETSTELTSLVVLDTVNTNGLGIGSTVSLERLNL